LIGNLMAISPIWAIAQTNLDKTTVSTAVLKAATNEFFAREIAVHFADIRSLDPPQERVLGALTTGDFSWGGFAGALAAQVRGRSAEKTRPGPLPRSA
jgi:hypothetical protein